MTPEEICFYMDGGPQAGGHDRYCEALCHHCCIIFLMRQPTHETPLGNKITEVLWPLRLQMEELQIYRIFPKVAAYYEIPFDIDHRAHTIYCGQSHEWRICLRALGNGVLEEFDKAYLIPDRRSGYYAPVA